jgi:BON domain
MFKAQELRKNSAADYYAGYYWGNHPYSSEGLPGHTDDEELMNIVLKNLRKNKAINSSYIQVSVFEGAVTLFGSVKTYRERRLAGEEAWRTIGVVKVLNELEVTDPGTAGPINR